MSRGTLRERSIRDLDVLKSLQAHFKLCTDGGTVDTGDLKSLGCKVVQVQVSLGAFLVFLFMYFNGK